MSQETPTVPDEDEEYQQNMDLSAIGVHGGLEKETPLEQEEF
jgi:hypothetical protein